MYEAGVSLDDALFPLAPTDSSAGGNVITWALVFDRCPLPARIFAALDDLLETFPLFAGRPTGKRYEVRVQPGRGVLCEYGVIEGASAAGVLASGLGFRSAPLAFPTAPTEELPYLALPDVNAMDKGQAQLVQCAALAAPPVLSAAPVASPG